MSELYNINELPDDTFPLSFKLIYIYHREDPFLPEELKMHKISKGLFLWRTEYYKTCNVQGLLVQ